jgi:hypothetical protein
MQGLVVVDRLSANLLQFYGALTSAGEVVSTDSCIVRGMTQAFIVFASALCVHVCVCSLFLARIRLSSGRPGKT